VQWTLRGVVVFAGLAMGALTACGDNDNDGSATTADAAETTASSSDGTSTGSTLSAADATEDDYLAAIERSLARGAETGQLVISSEQAECVAPKWLDIIGFDRLTEQGITPAQIGDDIDDDGSALSDLGLTEDEGNALYDAFGECSVDVEQQFLTAITDELNQEAAACVADAVSGDLLRRLLVAVLVQGDAAEDELQADIGAAVAPCEELQQGATTTSG
jgi:hypothetical protein